MKAKLLRMILSASQILVVVGVHFCMALKAQWNRIFDFITAALLVRSDMIGFHLHTAEPVAKTTSPMTRCQELIYISLVESLGLPDSSQKVEIMMFH